MAIKKIKIYKILFKKANQIDNSVIAAVAP